MESISFFFFIYIYFLAIPMLLLLCVGLLLDIGYLYFRSSMILGMEFLYPSILSGLEFLIGLALVHPQFCEWEGTGVVNSFIRLRWVSLNISELKTFGDARMRMGGRSTWFSPYYARKI